MHRPLLVLPRQSDGDHLNSRTDKHRSLKVSRVDVVACDTRQELKVVGDVTRSCRSLTAKLS